MAEFAIKPPDVFVFDGPNVSQRWTRWAKQFETYYLAAELSSKAKGVQVAILLNAAGPEAQEVHEQFTYTDTEARDDYKVVLTKFEAYCRPRKNVVYERHRFRGRNQVEEEPVDKWVKDLRIIAKDCDFEAQEDSMIRDQIVYGVHDKRVQERMLRDSKLDLAKAVELCRAAESSRTQMIEISKGPQVDINEMKTQGAPGGGEGKGPCFNCGLPGHQAKECTQEDKREESVQCYNCEGWGHLSSVCPSGDSYPKPKRRGRSRGRGGSRSRSRGRSSRSRGRGRPGPQRVDELETASETDQYTQQFATLTLLSIEVNALEQEMEGRPSKRYVKFRFHNLTKRDFRVARLKIDSGSQRNTMTTAKFKELYPEKVGGDGRPRPELVVEEKPGCPVSLVGYGGAEVGHHGAVMLPVEYNGQKFTCQFYITETKGDLLLGLPTAEALGIVKITVVDECSAKVDAASVPPKTGYVEPETPISARPPIKTKADLKAMYPECFDPKDKYWKDFEYDIKIDPSVEPKVHPPRRVPLELRVKLKAKLDEMVQRGIIAKVDQPTKWVSSVLVKEKPNGELRICLDPTDLNKAVMRDHHPTPVIDDITPELSGSDVFTKLDLKDGYWHVRLNERSSFLTTFNTPFGRYRFLRMPFGLKMSQDVFQFKVDETYANCEGAIGISDDITVHGRGEKNHDFRLHTTMETTRKNNLCLNYAKVSVKQPSVKFYGNIFSAQGVTADPEKVEAINKLRPPETKTELKTFLGMVNYLQQFIPRLAEHTAPLRALEKKDVHFRWESSHQESFDNLKALVSNNMMLAYYDRTKEATLQCDYSEQGLGVALVQEDKPVRFASKALVDGEKGLPPIEGEMLGVVYGIKKFHIMYARARDGWVTDHYSRVVKRGSASGDTRGPSGRKQMHASCKKYGVLAGDE